MLCLTRIRSLVNDGAYGRLLDAIERNGHALGRGTRSMVAGEGNLAVAALALAVRRAAELSFYRVSPELKFVVERLLAQHGAEGGFGSVAATALAVRALWEVEDLDVDGRQIGGAVSRSADNALQCLARQQCAGGLIGTVADTEFCLSQLSGSRHFNRFLEAVHLDGLRHAMAWSRWAGILRKSGGRAA